MRTSTCAAVSLVFVVCSWTVSAAPTCPTNTCQLTLPDGGFHCATTTRCEECLGTCCSCGILNECLPAQAGLCDDGRPAFADGGTVDSGTQDAGLPPADAGAHIDGGADAGGAADAGPPADGGANSPDGGGPPQSDGGSGGGGGSGSPPGGCGCTALEGMALLPLACALWLARRRRSRRPSP